jgi:hypothetical protein
MRWVEVIKLRVSDANRDVLERQLSELVAKVDHKGGLRDVRAYHNAAVSSDLCVHLYWTTDRVMQQGSSLGLCLCHVLRESGLVSHGVWIED